MAGLMQLWALVWMGSLDGGLKLGGNFNFSSEGFLPIRMNITFRIFFSENL